LRSLVSFINRMNIWVWLLGIFAAHALLYLFLGTATWMATALLATAFYGIVLLVAKLVAGRYGDKEHIK
jgi:O-antigen ligase